MSNETEVENPFSSVSRMCEALGLPDSKFSLGWRLTNAVGGQINALPRSRGRVIATDGMMCIILTEDNRHLFGHYSWFEPDKDEDKDKLPTVKGKRVQKVLSEFIV